MEKVSKISPANFKPKENVGLLKGDGSRLPLGVIVGTVTGIKEKKGPNDMDVFTALVGSFSATPIDPKTGELLGDRELRSGICYLPGGMQDDIEAQFAGDDPVQRIDFAAELAIFKAENAIGYSWAMKPLVEPAESDPVNALMAAAITARKTGKPAQITSPAKSGAKGEEATA